MLAVGQPQTESGGRELHLQEVVEVQNRPSVTVTLPIGLMGPEGTKMLREMTKGPACPGILGLWWIIQKAEKTLQIHIKHVAWNAMVSQCTTEPRDTCGRLARLRHRRMDQKDAG